MAAAPPPRLPMDLRSEARVAEKTLADANAAYVERHPEINRILSDFVCAALVEQPTDLFEFARHHFSGVDSKGKVEWPELVGETAESASNRIKADQPGVFVVVVNEAEGDIPASRNDRVRVLVDDSGLVTKPPVVG